MKTAEQCYELIVKALLGVTSGNYWAKLNISASILKNNLGGTRVVETKPDGSSLDLSMGWEIFEVQNAALFLRDDIFLSTGQRIWGLNFTLHPDGRFSIEYDYNKPEDYEESDDFITGDEINSSLNQLTGKKDTSS